jgi:hypothetical protein
MKPELERVKGDLETMQKAIGITPAGGREWIQWLKRDNWLNLWWALPGLILIIASLARLDGGQMVLGLAAGQWVGLLVAAVLLGMLVFWGRLMKSGVRPAGVVREYRTISALGGWFLAAFLVQFAVYAVWARQHGIGGSAFMAGLWLLCGMSTLLLATITKAWVYLGWAIPLLAFGLCQPLVRGKSGGLWLGLVFIAAALLCSLVQALQFRALEKEHAAD